MIFLNNNNENEFLYFLRLGLSSHILILAMLCSIKIFEVAINPNALENFCGDEIWLIICTHFLLVMIGSLILSYKIENSMLEPSYIKQKRRRIIDRVNHSLKLNNQNESIDNEANKSQDILTMINKSGNLTVNEELKDASNSPNTNSI